MLKFIMKILAWMKRYFRRLNTGMVAHVPGSKPIKAEEQPSAGTPKKSKSYINLILFIVTFFSTTAAEGIMEPDLASMFSRGLPYSLTLLSILLFHEFGHYFAARRFGVDASLPYFIPLLIPLRVPFQVGTMGAVIKTRTPIPDRRALLYIGAMGPLPGFILSLAAVIYGLMNTSIAAMPALKPDEFTIIFGDSALLLLLNKLILGATPDGYVVQLTPYIKAGWFGFLITGLNLMPIGQLDGGHILYAMFGKKQRYAGWIMLAVLSVLCWFWSGWVIWIVLTLTVLMVAHPPVPDTIQLTPADKFVGWLCILVFFLIFVPAPVQIIEYLGK